MNTLISIGYLGGKKCYLNISVEEAIKRFCKDDGDITPDDFQKDKDGKICCYVQGTKQIKYHIYIFYFDDEFEAYDIWSV